jgi:hypothetical protein
MQLRRRGKQPFSVSSEIAVSLENHLVSLGIPYSEAVVLSRKYPTVPLALLNSSLSQKQEPQVLPPQTSTADFLAKLSGNKRQIYDALSGLISDPEQIMLYVEICESVDEAMANFGGEAQQIQFRYREEGEFVFDEANTKEEKCSICLEIFARGHVLKTLPCFHRFHKECVNDWLRTGKKICPTCQTKVKY